MSRTVDERVVSMQFDNKNFENNVQTTLGSLDKLKQSLNFTGASKGFENINSAASRVNMGGISSAIETVHAKFSAMEVMAVTALANITNSAVNAGKRIVSALTIEPIKTGFQEYETQINAVQTILANTESKGTTLKDVNKALDELNTYADKTIYNFTEMTRNIGTFTAAGVDLDTSVSAIQGIANLAAVSGSTSQQASTAMYQLSQALASGTVKLQDWNSVVNAGMGGQVFQDALKRTAKVMGTDVDALIKKYGSFRDSLSQGEWLTTEVLTKTLNQFTMAAKEGSTEWNEFKKSLMADGYTEKQAIEILKMANTATDAATKVKTFTQLFDTLKEAAQSGWTQTWEIIVGDFEEAKGLLTNISNVVGDIINNSAKARNDLLQGWKKEGGRDDLLESFKNIWHFIQEISSIGKGVFDKIFPAMTVEQLKSITQSFEDFTKKLTLSDETADKLERTFSGLFSIVSIFGKILGSVTQVIGSFLGGKGVSSVVDLLLTLTASVGDFFTSLNKSFETNGITASLINIANTVSDVISKITEKIGGFEGMISSIGDIIVKAFKFVGKGVSDAFSWISENVGAFDIFAGLTGGGIALLATKLSGLVGKFSELMDGGILGLIFGGKKDDEEKVGILSQIGDVFGSLGESLQAFTTSIKVGSLVAIAAAIGILSAALGSIAELEVENIAKSLVAMGTMFIMLNAMFKSIASELFINKTTGIVKAGFSLILMAGAIKIMAGALEKIGNLSFKEIIKGLIGMAGAVTALVTGTKAIDKVNIKVSTGLALIMLAKSCEILGNALGKFSKLAWDEIARGLVAMGGALGEFVIAIRALDKVSGFNSLFASGALLIAVQSLDELSENLEKFGDLSWEQIKLGLAGMGGALAELGVTIGVLGKFTGFKGILGGGALVIGVQSLEKLADALEDFGDMDWDEIGSGLAAMGGALGELALAVGLLGKFTGFKGILGAGSLVIGVQALGDLADALKDFSEMNWEEIERGLAGMGGALAELALAVGLLGGLTGFGSILGAGGILIGVQGLGDLAEAMKKFGEMTWDEIDRGLVGMGYALTELALVTGILGTLAPLGSLLGGGAILLGVQGLGDLADALKKFGEMSWEEINRGINGMAGALGALAVGTLLNSLSILGSMSIDTVAKPLGDLAESIKKWKDVVVPEKLGTQLVSLAAGIYAFTFDGLGAMAVSTAAEPLGVMADSVRKWKDVVVPEKLGTQLASLASGIYAFTFDGLGGMVLSSAAEPLGVLADSVRKWKDVTIPDGLGDKLKTLADGIGSFSFGFLGGWSLSTIVEPFGKFTEAVNKWNGVTIPDDLADKLKSLAEAIGSFSFGFLSGWSMETIVGPLGKLADDVKKWNGVTIPDNLGDKLKELASGIKSFPFALNIKVVSDAFSKIAEGVTKISNVEMKSVSDDLVTLATSISEFAASCKDIKGVGNNIVKEIIKPIEDSTGRLEKAGAGMIKSIAKGIDSVRDTVDKSIDKIVKEFIDSVTDGKKDASKAGEKLGKAVATGAKSARSDAYSAGAYLVSGFANGISANTYLAVNKARAMGQATTKALKNVLAVKSPSRVAYGIGNFFGVGFVNAISEYGDKAYDASADMATSAKNGLSNAISRISDIVNTDIDTQPTIRPVLDLSEVESGANSIGSMFGLNPSIGVLATANGISASMNSTRQNGINSDIVSAINKLDKHLDNVGGTSYNINGITYDDGSNVSDAVKTLVRATRMERRV